MSLVFTDNFFEKGIDSKEKLPKIDKIDFDSLIDRVKEMPARIRDTALWTEVFKLQEWYFIVKPDKNIENIKPFIGKVDDKGWFFLFTDGKHADEFAKVQGFINENGNAITIAMEPIKASEWMSQFEKIGVYGARFNEGEHGWFTPIANLLPMHSYLKKLNKVYDTRDSL
jgi:hypothetical protein